MILCRDPTRHTIAEIDDHVGELVRAVPWELMNIVEAGDLCRRKLSLDEFLELCRIDDVVLLCSDHADVLAQALQPLERILDVMSWTTQRSVTHDSEVCAEI